ncbi:MAG: amidohydrolase family protein [Mucilaginibacter sp.]
MTFDNALVFPGLINSHDHLDFNLFPQFGRHIYDDYTEWGRHLHQKYHKEISGILNIPITLRQQWGIYKNLLCGVTTVVNHGERTGLSDSLITVFEQSHCLHSLQFEKYWKIKLNNPLKRHLPVNIHIGEGNNLLCSREADKLAKCNLLRRKLIGVHSVSMSAKQAKKFEAVVWCPASNYYLLGKTAKIDKLKKSAKILFGTDSTLTGPWNIWEHLRLAEKTKLLSNSELYASVTQSPADTWQLNGGRVEEGMAADLVVARQKDGKAGFGAFFALSPADLLLVVHKGRICSFDEELLPQLATIDLPGFSKVFVGNACKYVRGNLPGLIQEIKGYQPLADFPVNFDESVSV